jgi:response regulator RpfG family c-di-GMP phosphodiesterase
MGLHILFEQQKNDLFKSNLVLENEVDKKSKTVIELQNAILKTVAELVECRDNVTGGHIERTQHYLEMLVDYLVEHRVYAEELLSWDIALFIMSSQLHDVGKISIKDDILMKPGKLTEDEFEVMKKHTAYGVDIIRRIEESAPESEFLRFAEIMAGSHHEKWNGKGYPRGLKGVDIPLQGRLMAIVDAYDAMTTERPYKRAYSHEESIEIIKEEKGAQFDPFISEVFLTHEKEFEQNDVHNTISRSSSAALRPTLMAVANIVGERNGNGNGNGKRNAHVERMRRYLEVMVNALLKHERYKDEVSSWDKELFLMSAQLHDVGKIAVADNILNKAEKLTDNEHEKIKGHTDFGAKVVQQMRNKLNYGDLLHHAEALAESHHEKWDGTGYPHGTKGDEIPLQGRIMAIVDVYNALTSDRPHRKRKAHKEAVETIKNGSGSLFSPELVNIFLESEKEFEIIADA